jgi:pseudouridine-5'-phosphate glycosidase/pseudouridine kinase
MTMASSRVSRPFQQALQSAVRRSQGCYTTKTGYQLACCHHRRAPSHHRSQRRSLSTASEASGLRGILKISEEVADAVATNKPVVALESTIYTHGFLGNDLAREHEELVRSHGGVPAIIAIVDGVPRVGVSSQDIVRMIEEPGTVKASRRDIAYLAGLVC